MGAVDSMHWKGKEQHRTRETQANTKTAVAVAAVKPFVVVVAVVAAVAAAAVVAAAVVAAAVVAVVVAVVAVVVDYQADLCCVTHDVRMMIMVLNERGDIVLNSGLH